MIQLNQVSLQFRDRVVLQKIDLHVLPFEAVGIIGPSGSGKSVLLKLMAGLLIPTTGTITLNSNRVSMLFQKNALFDSFSLLDNLLVPLEETLGVSGTIAFDRAMGLLKDVGLEQSAHLHPDEISGGMQKRLGIARALIVDPEVLLYDEPTAGLDPITSRSIADLILKLHQKNKTTLVMVTNDLQRVYQVADRILFCANGSLTEAGSPTELKNTLDPVLKNFIFSNAIHSGRSLS